MNRLSDLLNSEPERARAHLLRHVSEIRMQPTEENGEKFYVAEGEWFVAENESVTGAMLDPAGGSDLTPTNIVVILSFLR